jgi:cell division septum initiation protein DivIVA
VVLNLALTVPLTLVPSIPVLLGAFGWACRWVYRHWRKTLASTIASAEAEAKDDLITTLEHNHAALADRVEILEQRLEEAEASNDRMKAELDLKTRAFETLKTYAAPEGFRILQTIAESNANLLGEVLDRLTQVETRQATATAALAEAIALLREVVVGHG